MMRMSAYRSTGFIITAVRKLFRVRLRITGSQHIPDRPVLFIANHFTRLETLVVPYAIYHATGQPIRTLAYDGIFHGVLKKYLHATGVMSLNDPRRNRTIIRDLITGDIAWAIYPEGGLIKDKKVVQGGKLFLQRPDRAGPPHTGAALLSIKAEVIRDRFLDAVARNDQRSLAYYREHYDLTQVGQVHERGPVIVPLTITYHELRPGDNFFSRLVRRIAKQIHPKLLEELLVEGRILTGPAEISVHFGKPIEVRAFVGRSSSFIRRLASAIAEAPAEDILLKRAARRLTDAAMRSVYERTEISAEHLFCYGLRALRADSIVEGDLHRAICMIILELQRHPELRLHGTLRRGVNALLNDEVWPELRDAVQRAIGEGAVAVEAGRYIVRRDVLDGPCDFQTARLTRMTHVLANEFEAIVPAADVVRRIVNLPPHRLRMRAFESIRRWERQSFERELQIGHRRASEPAVVPGEAFFLRAKRSDMGVVLIHGYLASPEEMRSLAEYLSARRMNVYAVRLPGHGTMPEHLDSVRAEDWYEAVVQGCGAMRLHSHRIAVVGMSMGGLLALQVAARATTNIGAVVAINAPYVLRDRRIPLVPVVSRVNSALKRLGVSGRLGELENVTENPGINYPRHSLDGVRELRRTMRACRNVLDQVSCPALIIQSTRDPHVHPRSADLMSERLGSSYKVVRELDTSRHVIVRGEGSQAVFACISEFLRQAMQPDSAPHSKTRAV